MVKSNLSQGLRLMYVGQIIASVSLLLMILLAVASVFSYSALPLVMALLAALAAFGGAITNLVGLIQLRREHRGYRSALVLMGVNAVAVLLEQFLPEGPGLLLGLAGTVVGLLAAYHIVRATNAFLAEAGEEALMARGLLAWRLNMVSGVVLAVVELVVRSDSVATPLLVALIALMIASLVALVLYISYLGRAGNALAYREALEEPPALPPEV